MIEIMEERKEPDLSTEEKKVSEECMDQNTDPQMKEAEEAKEAAAEETKAEEETAEAPEKAEEKSEEKSEEETAHDGEGAEKESEDAGEEPDMLFGNRKLKKELEKKDELIKEQNDKYLRLMAEFDNYRKRTEKEKSGMYAMGAKDVVEKILPVVDNFERGFSLVAEEDAEDPFTEGMQKIYKQLMTTLTDLGVTPIEAVGKEFDPNLHNAVMHVEDESVGENSVVRHSMVQVAN